MKISSRWRMDVVLWRIPWLLCAWCLVNNACSETIDHTVVKLTTNDLLPKSPLPSDMITHTPMDMHDTNASHVLHQCDDVCKARLSHVLHQCDDVCKARLSDALTVDVTFIYDKISSEKDHYGVSTINPVHELFRIFEDLSYVIKEYLHTSFINESSGTLLQSLLHHLQSTVELMSSFDVTADRFLSDIHDILDVLGDLSVRVSEGVCETIKSNSNKTQAHMITSLARGITTGIENAELILLDLLLERHLSIRQPVAIRSEQIEITLSKMSRFPNKATVSRHGFRHHLVDNFLIPDSVLKQHGVVTIQTKTTKYNPYTCGEAGCRFGSGTKSLSLVDDRKAEIPVQDTSEPFVILFPRDDFNTTSKDDIINSIPGFDIPRKMAVMTIRYSTVNQLFCYDVYLARQQTLTKETIDFIHYEVANAHAAKAKVKGSRNRKPQINFQYLRSSHGVDLEEADCPFHAIPQDPVEERASARIESHSCLFWDEDKDSWKHDGCWVSPASRTDTTVCMCNHLTTFAVVVVPINTIDFTHAFSQDLSENAMVFTFVVVVISIYLLAVAYMRRKDRADVLKWAAHPLVDNKEGNSYFYTVSVYTGHAKGSTCRSQVAFDLIGDDGYTEGRLLQDAKNFLKLDQGSMNHYLMSVPSSLGRLRYMPVWHDNSGEGAHASWFLYWIVVCDLQTNQRYAFSCNNWLALNRNDGQIIRNLKAAEDSDNVQVQGDFFRILRETFSDDNLWMSLLNRPTPSNFNRVQRLSVCLALAFLYMISNAMFYRDDPDELNDKPVNVLGLFEINFQAVYVATITSLIMIPANLLVVTIFRKARPRKGPSTFSKKKNLTDMTEIFTEAAPKKTSGIPWWTVYIGWAILFCAVFLSGFFVVLYTLDWGKEKAEKWFISMLTSFLESILILEPLKAIFAAMLILTTVKLAKKTADFSVIDPGHFVKVEMEGKKKSTMNIPLDDGPTIRPLDDEYIANNKQKWVQHANTQEIVRMIFSHIFFVLITLAIIILYRDYYTFWTTKAIDDMFLVTNRKGEVLYHLIKTPEEFYPWAKEVAIPSIFPTHNYNWNWKVREERMFMDGGASYRVGRVRLRQMRVQRNTCKRAYDMLPLTVECNDEYSGDIAEKRNFHETWRGETDEPCKDEDIKSCPWEFHPGSSPVTSTLFGHSGVAYDNSGYIADLGSRSTSALEVLDYLRDTHWMDRYTRYLVMEFVVYNANLNHFSFVSYYIEFPETNGAYPGHETHTFRLYDYASDAELVAVAVTLLHIFYIMWLIHTCFEEFENLKKAGKMYFKSVDNWAEIAVIASSLASVVVYMIRKMAVIGLEDSIKDVYYVQPIFQNIAFLDKVYAYVMSSVGFMGMVKVNLLLAFDHRFTQMTRTLKRAALPIFWFTLVFLLVFFGFVALNYITMGADTKDYKSLLATSESLLTTLLGKFRFSNFERDSGREFGMAIFAFYCVVQGFVLLTMFMSIIIDAFSEVKREDENLKNVLSLESVCWDEFQRFVEGTMPDELQVWKTTGKVGAEPERASSPVSTDDIQIKDRPPDKFDLHWRVRKCEEAIRLAEGALQKLSNKVDEYDNTVDEPNKMEYNKF